MVLVGDRQMLGLILVGATFMPVLPVAYAVLVSLLSSTVAAHPMRT